MDSVTLWASLSATTNRIVEIVCKPIVRKIADQLGLSDEAYVFLMKLTAVVLGIIQAIMWNVNFFGGYPLLTPVAGYILTGLSVGLGAEFADAFIDFFYAGKPGEKPVLNTTGTTPSVVAPATKTVQVDMTSAAHPLNG